MLDCTVVMCTFMSDSFLLYRSFFLSSFLSMIPLHKWNVLDRSVGAQGVVISYTSTIISKLRQFLIAVPHQMMNYQSILLCLK